MTPCDDGDPCNGSEKCDGGDACMTGTPLSCGNYACGSTGCLTSCTESAQCAVHFYCDTASATCFAKLGPSSACLFDEQCNVGSCFDGGCCDETADTDPLAATSIDPTHATDFVTQVQPLYSGTSPPQLLGAPNAIEPARVAVIRGRVLDEQGSVGIPCAKISVPASASLGTTRTRADGSYAIAVNGGGPVTVRVELAGYLSADRTVQTRFQTYAQAPTVRLLAFGAETQVPTDSGGVVLGTTLISGDQETDAQGSRAARLVLPTGTQVIVEGEDLPRTDVTIRVKEMTNTSIAGRDAMIASLPVASAFTYAVNISLKGAENQSIELSQPVPVHVNNFLNIAIGETVPVGYYDTAQQQWVASGSGRVIKIMGVNTNGEAELDTDTTAGANPEADLDALGITHAERAKLAAAPYTVGMSLWRFQTDHFSTWDCNWGWGPPGPTPKNPAPSPPPPPCVSTVVGSLIDCEGQALREQFPIAGTPFSLYYSSARQPGGQKPLRIPLTADTLPADLQGVKLEINVAGRRITQDFSAPVANQSYDFRWDGRDAAGRMLVGAQPIGTSVGFHYSGTYRRTARFGASGQSAVVAEGNNRFDATIWQSWSGYIEHWDAQQTGLGGWDFDVHHGYDPLSGTLHRGDGRDEIVPSSLTTFKKLPLAQRPVPLYNALAVGPDGSLYFVDNSDGTRPKLKKLALNGSLTTIAGEGTATTYPYGDGGAAHLATLFNPYCLAVGPNQKLYVCEGRASNQSYGRVRVIDLAASPPVITAFAGGGPGQPPTPGTSVLPTSVRLFEPRAISALDDGTVLIADNGGDNQLYRVRDQQLTVFASLAAPAMAAGKDGTVYVASLGNDSNILKIDPTGTITELTHSNYHGVCSSHDEGPAATTCLASPSSLAVGPDGLLYISDSIAWKVKRIGPAGNIETVLGTGSYGNGPNGLAGRQTAIGGAGALAIGPDGTLYVAESNSSDPSIRYSKPSVARSFPAVVPSTDGSELYKFDSAGHHAETVDAHTGILRYAFRYNSAGYLTGISDRALSDVERHEMTIARTSGPTGIQIDLTAPFGQPTTLLVAAADKMLTHATDPEGGVHQFEYFNGNGLLRRMWDPNGFVQQSPYQFNFTDGFLSSDIDPLGHGQGLVQSAIPNGWRVTRTDQLMRPTTYDTKSLDPLHTASTVTGPDGMPLARTVFLDGGRRDPGPDGNLYSSHQRNADGSATFSSSDGDPSLGLRAPVASTTVEFMDAAADLKRTTTRSRNIVLSNPNDLASAVQSFTETQNINGRAQPQKTEYNAAARQFTITSAAGRKIVRTIDSMGRTRSLQIGTLAPNTFEYDDTLTRTGKLSRETRTDGAIQLETRYSYFGSGMAKMAGYLDTVSHLRNSVVTQSTSYSTDAFGRILLETTNNDTSNFSWDGNGNLSTVDPPGALQHGQTYSLLDQLLSYEPPKLPATPVNTGYTYTADRKLESRTDPDGVTTNWIYDQVMGKLTDVTHPAGNSHFDYFSALETAPGQAPGRLKFIGGPYGVNLSFNYRGRLATLTKWTRGADGATLGTVGWAYNNDFARIAETITDGAGTTRTILFGYGDADGFLTCASLSSCSPPATSNSLSVSHDSLNGLLATVNFGSLTETYGYDAFGQLASKTAQFGSAPLLRSEYDDLSTGLWGRRDALGRILRRKQTLDNASFVTFDYTYSPEGRLTDVRRNGQAYEHYDYGGQNGNRSAAIAPTLSVAASEVSYDVQDRLKSYGPYRYTYNNNGTLLTKTDTRTTPVAVTSYAYDALGNLLSVTPPTGPVISYTVDGQNRRIAKKIGTSVVKQWLYRDGLKPVAELDGAGTLVSIFVYGSNSITPDLVVRNTGTYRLLTDHVGSVIRAINVSAVNDVPFAAEYTAFGEQTVSAGTSDFVPFGFAGGLYDTDTGLVRFGARDYDPVVGRWTSKDPILFRGRQTNLYVYVGNDPVNHIDPNGLQTIPFPWWGPIAGGAAAGAGVGSAVAGVGAIPGAIVGGILAAAVMSVPGDTAICEPDDDDRPAEICWLDFEAFDSCYYECPSGERVTTKRHEFGEGYDPANDICPPTIIYG